MKYPFLSIVVVNFNGGSYLRTALQSIINQNFKNYELLVCDGGSTDDSVSIIKENENFISWWVSEKDNGQSHAFNKAFKKAKGEFFLWLNSDDILVPGALEKIYKNAKEFCQFKWFIGNTIFINNEDRIIKFSAGIKYPTFLTNYFGINVGAPSTIFHRDIFTECNGFDEALHYCMDTDLWIRAYNLGYTYKLIPNYIWAFRIHDDSKTSGAYSDNFNKQYLYEVKHIKKKYHYNDNFISIFARRFYQLFSIYTYKSILFNFLYRDVKFYHLYSK